MASYTGMLLTNKGRILQAKAEAGAVLNFTKVKIGDGQLTSGQTLEALNDLVHPLKTLPIQSVQPEGNGLCRIRSLITNDGIMQGFYVREIGVFAQDPDVGEILYGVATATTADYLPPEGGATVVTSQFDIIIVVSNAQNITATISNAGFVLKSEVGIAGGVAKINNEGKVMHADGTVVGEVKTVNGQTGEVILSAEDIGAETPDGAQQKIDTAVTDLINGAPGALDTLKELSEALGGNPDFAATVINRLAEAEQRITQNEESVSTHSLDDTLHNFSVKTIKLNKDDEGIFTTVEHRRKSDNTLARKAVLSGGSSPQYTTRTITYYAPNGTTIVKTDTFTLSYDSDGVLISEV